MKRPLDLSHDFLAECLDKTSVAIDATMGNGHDTVFLAQRAKKVYAFDIQAQAIEKTTERLNSYNLTNTSLIQAGHEAVLDYVKEPIRAAIFNLGYLPSADKSVITQATTTIAALDAMLTLLEVGGRIAVMIYYGHAGGQEEKDALLSYVCRLPQENFTVISYRPLNQKNTPPFLVLIEKLR